MHTYIFGYGSLISSFSRAHTVNSEECIAARVHGIARSWSYVNCEREHTVLGASLSDGSTTNGVIVKLESPDALRALDEREKDYFRKRLKVSDVEILDGEFPKDAVVWVYLLEERDVCPPYPIPRSYIDTVLFGCLEYSEEFAREFLRTTTGWEAGLKSDRDYPDYPRFERQTDYYSLIDRLLVEELINNLRSLGEGMLPLDVDTAVKLVA